MPEFFLVIFNSFELLFNDNGKVQPEMGNVAGWRFF